MEIAAEDLPTPPLRDDLRLDEAAPGPDGEPVWVIHDSVLNRFYRIGWLEFECLLRWEQTPRQISEQIAEQTALKPEAEQVLGFRQFLEQHQLLRPGAEALARLQARSEGGSWMSWNWWLHHYLFFRIPLIRPQRFLRAIAGSLDWLFNRYVAMLVLLLSLAGIVLVTHQWDTFTHDVVESFSFEGLLSFAAALVVAKTLHELGHALVATRLGLKVAHMGIAFVVMWPMLYTDTGESWKLRSNRQRLAIASAGIITELGWPASPHWLGAGRSGPVAQCAAVPGDHQLGAVAGPERQPFMRFDGYFITSDLLDFPNLHERAGALARTTLRRNLLGLDEPWPEHFPTGKRRALVAFAFGTWVYRLLLFLGIAVAVYYFFFKLLGIFLFAVEISWFIVQPVWRELKVWWQRRAEVKPRRKLVFLAVLGGVLLLLAIPWRTQVHAMGVARAAQQLHVYAPFPALLRDLRPGGAVGQGETLAVMEEPDIAAKVRGSEAGIRGYQGRLAGMLADPSGLAEEAVTRQRLGVEYQQARAARNEMARLNLQAPFAGQWRDVNPDWKPGQWINTREPIGVLVDPRHWLVDAYVKQDEVQRLTDGGRVRFYPEGVPSPIEARWC